MLRPSFSDYTAQYYYLYNIKNLHTFKPIKDYTGWVLFKCQKCGLVRWGYSDVSSHEGETDLRGPADCLSRQMKRALE
jgi:hypothetical protein